MNNGRVGDLAFTVVELLVVVTVLAVLAAIVLPTVTGAKHAAVRAACASNLRQLGAAILAYANDHEAWMPPANQWWNGQEAAFNHKAPTNALRLVKPCLATLFYQGYAGSKWIFYDPGFEVAGPDTWDAWQAWRFAWPEKPAGRTRKGTATESGAPATGGWPDIGGNFIMGYYWFGGYNIGSCPWSWLQGNNPASRFKYAVWSGGDCEKRLYTDVTDPARYRPLSCIQYEDWHNTGAAYYMMYSHAKDGKRYGMNTWALDGHIEFIPASQAVFGTDGGCCNRYWAPPLP